MTGNKQFIEQVAILNFNPKTQASKKLIRKLAQEGYRESFRSESLDKDLGQKVIKYSFNEHIVGIQHAVACLNARMGGKVSNN